MAEEKKWLDTWDEDEAHYSTVGNTCPRCGKDYVDHVGVRDTYAIYAVADGLELECRCPACGLEFEETWMWIDATDGNEARLVYVGTYVDTAAGRCENQ